MTWLSKAEWWLLDVVVELLVPLHFLVSRRIEQIFNRKAHSLDRQELLAALGRLFQQGYVLSSRGDWDKERFVPTTLEIEQAFTRVTELYYGLTEKGGQTWESVAKPDWTHYLRASEGTDPDDAEVTAMERPLVEQYVEFQYRQRYSNYLVVPGSEQWEDLSPWQATYWKVLPRGHKVRFLITRNPDWPERFIYDDEAGERVRRRGEDDARNRWFFDRIYNWYCKYDDSAG